MDFKENDRVIRKNSKNCVGTVTKLRRELGTSNKKSDNMLIEIQWDNGTRSYFSPDSIEAYKG